MCRLTVWMSMSDQRCDPETSTAMTLKGLHAVYNAVYLTAKTTADHYMQ